MELIEKILSEKNLQKATRKVKKNKRRARSGQNDCARG